MRDELLERAEPVAHPRRVLEAEVSGKAGELLPGQRHRVHGVVQLEPVERARRELRAPLAAERPERTRLRHDLPALFAALEVDVALGPRGTRVGRRAQLAEEAELLERGLELRPEHAPLHAVERPEGRLDRGALSSTREVRAQARAQVARLADVEHRAVAVVEEVDAGQGRSARDEGALRAELPRARRRQRDEIADGAGAALLREAHEPDEDLRGGDRIRKRAVAWLDRHAEEMRELPQRDALAPAGEQAAREPDGVEDGRGAAAARQTLDRAVEERHVEASVVRDERGVARELEETPERELDARRLPEVLLPDSGQRRDEARQRGARIDERLERVDDLERAHAHGPDLADAAGLRGEPGRLEVEDDELGLLERHVRVRIVREADARPDEGKPRVAVDDVAEERAGERGRGPLEREQHPRRLVRADRTVPRLHELDEPVGGIERELHRSSLDEHTFAYKTGQKRSQKRRKGRLLLEEPALVGISCGA